MQKVTINQAKDILSKVAEGVFASSGQSPAVMMHSKPGVGKSSIVKQIADDLGADFVDVRLAAMDAAHVQGIPYVNDAGQMEYSTPTWFPENNGKPVIVFFDEINNALQSVQHAAYRLILDREIHNGKKFHDKVMVVAAGNRKEDKTGAKAMVPALGNRFAIHMEVAENKEDFVEYILGKYGTSDAGMKIVGMLEWQGKLLHQMPSAGQVSFPSPRSWEMVLGHLETFGSNPNGNFGLSVAVNGAVGESAGQSFMAYLKYYSRIPNFQKIREGKEEYDPSKAQKDLGLQFAITTSLVQHAAEAMLMIADDEKKGTAHCENLLSVYETLPDENRILFVKSVKTILDKNKYMILRSPFRKVTELKKYLK